MATTTAAAVVVSDSDTNSTTNSDAEESSNSTSTFESSILSAYLSHSSTADLSKIKSFLTSASTSSTCLICLCRLRHSDPIWSCSSSCYALFHLACIQSWAHQSLSLLKNPSLNPNWHCPKCRLPYPKSLTPSSYLCFCGKLPNPPLDPWILPHSCGEVCGRNLVPDCGHQCLLLCHPGPCPPCPQFVTTKCFCGSHNDTRRCAQKHFSCGGCCGKLLPCGRHRCKEVCHEGDCAECRVGERWRCLCGKEEEVRECFERRFRCGGECGEMLGCGKHKCGRGCHEGECGECPLRGRRTCPCGKKEYIGVACDVEVANCGSTCEKVLGCRRHRCPERCHRGQCVETCRTVVMKACRCGSLKKEVRIWMLLRWISHTFRSFYVIVIIIHL